MHLDICLRVKKSIEHTYGPVALIRIDLIKDGRPFVNAMSPYLKEYGTFAIILL